MDGYVAKVLHILAPKDSCPQSIKQTNNQGVQKYNFLHGLMRRYIFCHLSGGKRWSWAIYWLLL